MAGAIATQAATRSGCSDGEVQRVQVAHGQPDHDRPLGPRRVEHVERVLRLLARGGTPTPSSGRSDPPLPRGSNVITRVRRAR